MKHIGYMTLLCDDKVSQCHTTVHTLVWAFLYALFIEAVSSLTKWRFPPKILLGCLFVVICWVFCVCFEILFVCLFYFFIIIFFNIRIIPSTRAL